MRFLYLLLVCSICFALAYSALLHANRQGDSVFEALRFNALVAVFSAILALALGARQLPQRETLLCGAAYGVALAAYLFCKSQALATGPMAATTLIGCSSLVFQTLLGSVFWRETVTLAQILGVVLMLAAMLCSVDGGLEKGGSRRWKLYCAGLVIANTAVGMIFKLHQSTAAAAQTHELLVAGFGLGALMLGICCRILPSSARKAPPLRRKLVLWAVLCSLASCGYNLLNARLSGLLPSIVFYPVFNGSVLVFALPVSVIFFREKITGRNAVGILLAVAAVLLLGNVVSLPL